MEMMKKKFTWGVALLFCSILFFVTSGAFAHDGAWGSDDDPCLIDWIGPTTELDLNHEDLDPFKGWATLTVKNVCGADWGDFHLRLYSSHGGDVDFVDTSPYQPQLWFKVGHTWQQDLDLTWTITNGGNVMNLFFYDDPISHGETAKIKVYTDNTKHHWSSFQVCVYPTPVPEPVTLTLLALGGVALLRRKK
jgi:hypothetical protein